MRGEIDVIHFNASHAPVVDRAIAEHAGRAFDIVADHFLYHMVRAVVGTALVTSRAAAPEAAMREVLGARDRAAAGPTAPPQGLCLEQVYEDRPGEDGAA